jgi:hypothetical protein
MLTQLLGQFRKTIAQIVTGFTLPSQSPVRIWYLTRVLDVDDNMRKNTVKI